MSEYEHDLIPTLTLHVARLHLSRWFYARLLGVQVVGCSGAPIDSVLLSRDATAPGSIQMSDELGNAEPFVLCLTTHPTDRHIESVRIEFDTVSQLLLACLRANNMRMPAEGWSCERGEISVRLSDPDGHELILAAPHAEEERCAGYPFSAEAAGELADDRFADESDVFSHDDAEDLDADADLDGVPRAARRTPRTPTNRLRGYFTDIDADASNGPDLSEF